MPRHGFPKFTLLGNALFMIIIGDIKMLENFICCLKSCINCFIIWIDVERGKNKGKERAAAGGRREKSALRRRLWERYGRGI